MGRRRSMRQRSGNTIEKSIAAQHEGWGRKWKMCSYDCMACGGSIDLGSSVDVCTACKGFWHRGCYGLGTKPKGTEAQHSVCDCQ